MMNRRRIAAWVGLAAALAAGVALIILLTSSPRHRLITIGRPAPLLDEANARRILDEQVAAARKAGEPILPEDFRVAPVDPSQNAALCVNDAAKIIDDFAFRHPQNKFYDLDMSARLSPEQWKLVDDTLQSLAPALAKMDQANARSGVDWQVKMASPALKILLRHLNGARAVANVLRPAALSAHRHGRDDEALRRAGQLLALASWVEQKPFMVTHLVAMGIIRIACETIADLVPELKIGTAPGDASAAQVAGLIAQLSDQRWLQNGFREVMQAERMAALDTVECLADGKLAMADLESMSTTRRAMTRPTTPSAAEIMTDGVTLVKNSTAMIAAAESQRLPEFRHKTPPPPLLRTASLQSIVSSFDRAAQIHYSTLSRLRLSATALAARWWMIDHDGRAPASLNDLVPKYLAAIPDDAVAAAPASISYRLLPEPEVFGVSPNARDKAIVRLTAIAATPASSAR
jgi:hypothetical protein